MPYTNDDAKDYSARWRSRYQRLTQRQLDARGQALAKLRAEEGMTQAELAQAVGGVSEKTIQNWEAGRGEGTRAKWRQLALVLGVDADDVFMLRPRRRR